MNKSGHQCWWISSLLISFLYPAIGIVSAMLAGAAASGQMRFIWRLSAFVGSAAVLAVHTAYERVRLRSTARLTAWHTSAAVALGAFWLALIANVHDLGSAAGYRPKMLIALAAWPLITAVPAFFAALILSAGFSRAQQKQ